MKDNMKSVNEVSKLSGVSRRTLQYYDEIGLLPPSEVRASGYRYYSEESLRRLWNILFYKELGISLDDIHLILENPLAKEKEILKEHKQMLLEKQSRLQKMILSVDRMLNDDFDISMLSDFDINRIEIIKKTYSDEIRALLNSEFFLPIIKSGFFPKGGSLVKNASIIINIDFEMIILLSGEVVEGFNNAISYGPESPEAKKTVADFRKLMNRLMHCDDATFLKIAQAYSDHKDILDKKRKGLAAFVYEAILNVYS